MRKGSELEDPLHFRGAVFGTAGQLLTLRHDTTDYACFVPGILLALRSMKSLSPGVTVGLEHLLGI